MTDAERKARAERAKTYRDEFLGPIVERHRDQYRARIVEIATTELNASKRADKLTALSFGLKLLDNIMNQLDADVADGVIAEHSIMKAENLEKMNPHQRRLLNILG